MKEIHIGTWHSTQGLEEVTCTCIGSKPGDPLGDICFNYLACRILNEVEEELSKRGGLVEVEVEHLSKRNSGDTGLDPTPRPPSAKVAPYVRGSGFW